MPNPELFGGRREENPEIENNGVEKKDSHVIEEVAIELLGKINENPEMKTRAEIYANRG